MRDWGDCSALLLLSPLLLSLLVKVSWRWVVWMETERLRSFGLWVNGPEPRRLWRALEAARSKSWYARWPCCAQSC